MKRFKKWMAALFQLWCWPSLLKGVMPSVEHQKAFCGREYKTVIDVGANKGQFAALARHKWPESHLICFEPLPAPRARLEKITKGGAVIHACAVGLIEGAATMHVASRMDSSSLLALGEAQKKLFAMEEIEKLVVPVQRLETVVDGSQLKRPVLLKMDIQGFEYEALKGAHRLLPFIDEIYIEASYVELYKGQKLIDDISLLLQNYEFRLVEKFNIHRHKGRDIQADILFERLKGRCYRTDA